MKKTFLITLGTIFICSSLLAQGVNFFGGTLDEALAKAKAENKQVFLDFYTDWCGPCKAVAQYVFPTEEAGNYFNTNFVSMTVDAEKGTGPGLANRFKVNVFPTFIVLDADGNLLTRWSGGSMQPKPADFIKKVETQIASGPAGSDPAADFMAQMERNTDTRTTRSKPGIDEFEGTYAEALAKAKAENKMLLLDCYTQWCGPCKIMDAEVFPREDVGDFINPKFIFLKIDMEHGEGPERNQTFRVRAYPTYIAIDGEGNELFRFEGYKSPDVFIAKIKGELDDTKKSEALQVRYQAGERDKTFLREYIGALAASNKQVEAKAIMEQLMSGLTDQEKLKSEYWIYWTLYGYARSESENLDFLVDNQYKFEVGKKEVTDFFVKMATSHYSAIAFAMRGQRAPSTEDLTTADELAHKFNLEHNATLALYRAAACAKVNGDIDGMIDAYEKYSNTVLSEYEQNSFLALITDSFASDLSENQLDRLVVLAKNESLQKRILAMKTRR